VGETMSELENDLNNNRVSKETIKKEANDNKGIQIGDDYYAFRSRGVDDLKLFF
jgi:hypothetical protein